MPSSQKWLPVATTTRTVTMGWASTSQRDRLLLTITAPKPTSSAQATCTDGMAESCEAIPVPIRP
jgi:hypothetical protein